MTRTAENESVLDDESAGALDHAGGDWPALFEGLVVLHVRVVVIQVGDGPVHVGEVKVAGAGVRAGLRGDGGECGGDGLRPSVQDAEQLPVSPLARGGGVSGVQGRGGLAEVAADVDVIDQDRDLQAALLRLGLDGGDLLLVPVHEEEPLPHPFRVAAAGLIERRGDHVLDGLGDRGGYPFVAGLRAGVRPAAGGRGGDVLRLADGGREVGDGDDLGHLLDPRMPRDRPVPTMQGDGRGVAGRRERRKGAGKADAGHPGIKKMAEIVAVADFTPAVREPEDIAAPPARRQAHPGPKARDKRVSASVTESIEDMIAAASGEAGRRDPQRTRQRVFLVDGNKQQLAAIEAEARERSLKVPVLIDYIHVSGYIGKAAAALHPGDSAAAGQWADGQLLRVLHGRAKAVAATLASVAAKTRANPRTRHLDLTDMDRAVTYLNNNHAHMKYDKALEKGWPI